MVELKKISDYEWEIPMEGDMRVPGRIFASEEFIEKIREDKSLEQVKNVARLPGILGASFAMPDIHQGYGFPIGGVAAFDMEEGVISPGGVGYDINCSVRLLKTNLSKKDLAGREEEILHSLFRAIPSGVGRGGGFRLDNKKMNEVLTKGARWCVEQGFGKEEDLKHIEDGGCIENCDPKFVSQKAKGRGMNQLGTLGAGNHFLDVLVVDEVFDESVARVFGLEKDKVVILIHCGSRGLGHQVASDYIKEMTDDGGRMMENMAAIDRELVYAPINSDLGKRYLSAMNCAANFAFVNKQLITHFVREDLKNYFPDFRADVVYDICHNIAKVERHSFLTGTDYGGQMTEEREVLVTRKGATRSFGRGKLEVSEDYREVGQPVILPGSMGTPSFVLVGVGAGEDKAFSSCAHGSGRLVSRTEAKRRMSVEEAKEDMKKRGVFVEFGNSKGLVEESPSSYKDSGDVAEICERAGLGRRVVSMKPLLVVIG